MAERGLGHTGTALRAVEQVADLDASAQPSLARHGVPCAFSNREDQLELDHVGATRIADRSAEAHRLLFCTTVADLRVRFARSLQLVLGAPRTY